MRTCGRWRGVLLVVAPLSLVGYVGWGGFLVRSGWGQAESAMAPQQPVPEPVDRVVRVASIQYAPVFAKPQQNRAALIELVRKAALGGAKIIVMALGPSFPRRCCPWACGESPSPLRRFRTMG